MAFNYPYGDTQQLNLNWFLAQWETFREQWATAEEGIDHALDAEIARVEAAMTDLYAARDAAAASKTAAQTAATNAASSATVSTQQATLAQSYANTAQTQAGIATAAAEAAGNSASSASTSATSANLSKTQAANSATAAQTAQTAAEAAETNIVSIITDAIQDAADAAAATATADAEAAADAAEASATAAAGSASDASDSATAAAGSATAAAGSATAAAGSATAAAGSASDAADSATAAAASAASIVVDSAMSDSSTNPVQNKVINGEITELKTATTQNTNDIGNRVVFASSKNDFTVANKIIKTDGTIETANLRNLTDYIPLNGCKSILFRLTEFRKSASETYNPISFFDASKNYISGVPSKRFGSNLESITGVPAGAVYVVGSWVMNSSAIPYMIGIYDGLVEDADGMLANDKLNGTPTVTVVSDTMTMYEFVSAINAYWTTYATMCRCRPWSFMYLKQASANGEITIDDYKNFCEVINKNFRQEVVNPEYSFTKNCNRINNAFSMPIVRFMDARLNTTSQIAFSLQTTLERKTEPSVIVSKDMSEMYVYAFQNRVKTTDGVNWSEPVPCSTGGVTLIHNNVALIDGTYYLFGARGNGNSDFTMMTSSDGINFTLAGDVFHHGYSFVDGETVNLWGNSSIIKDYGSNTYYLYVEYMATGESVWKVSLVTATDMLQENEDDTIGNWTSVDSNPILTKLWTELDGTQTIGVGNPDFIKGSDNRPVKYNDKYYMLVHSTHAHSSYGVNGTSNILRLSSTDLVNWQTDGLLLDNRDIPTQGDNTSGNADHCIIEFKGRTYLFYSWNVNNTSQATIPEIVKYMIDDRPITELLKLRP